MRQGRLFYVLHSDRNWSITAVTDNAGSLVGQQRYTAYGKLTSRATSQLIGATPARFATRAMPPRRGISISTSPATTTRPSASSPSPTRSCPTRQIRRHSTATLRPRQPAQAGGSERARSAPVAQRAMDLAHTFQRNTTGARPTDGACAGNQPRNSAHGRPNHSIGVC